jgi:hypothetical protein
MSAERKKIPMVITAMIGMAMSDPEALLFGYALAVSKGDEDSLEIAEFFKKQAEALGVTEDQFMNAIDAMKKTDERLAGLQGEAS